LLSDLAARYANALLAGLGREERTSEKSDHPAIAWRRSGLMQATQYMLPLPLIAHVDGALMALRALNSGAELPRCGALLMGERARLRGTVRRGLRCAGGYGQLLEARGGRFALNLVREEDWDLIPAWLEDADITNWEGIAAHVKDRSLGELLGRAAELGLAAAKDHLPRRPKSWFSVRHFTPEKSTRPPLVVDLSALWAGPLASSLLMMCGARVIKVEGPDRPDGMRAGHAEFYARLNAGKACVALDFRSASDLSRLKDLLERADIVIEGSRPRALRQLGIDAADFTARKPGKIWARLTAYGQDKNQIGFGDDIGIAAGLASVMERAHGQACFAGDAIADPVNSVHLALGINAAFKSGGGMVLDFSMLDVLRYAMGKIPYDLAAAAKDYSEIANLDNAPFYPHRSPRGQVKALGADTARLC
jgi:hypothetical protein